MAPSSRAAEDPWNRVIITVDVQDILIEGLGMLYMIPLLNLRIVLL